MTFGIFICLIKVYLCKLWLASSSTNQNRKWKIMLDRLLVSFILIRHHYCNLCYLQSFLCFFFLSFYFISSTHSTNIQLYIHIFECHTKLTLSRNCSKFKWRVWLYHNTVWFWDWNWFDLIWLDYIERSLFSGTLSYRNMFFFHFFLFLFFFSFFFF